MTFLHFFCLLDCTYCSFVGSRVGAGVYGEIDTLLLKQKAPGTVRYRTVHTTYAVARHVGRRTVRVDNYTSIPGTYRTREIEREPLHFLLHCSNNTKVACGKADGKRLDLDC
jgi:hypothetical protein